MTNSIYPFVKTGIAVSMLIASFSGKAGWFSDPTNFHECILERLPGVQNDLAAIAETNQCRQEFPDFTPPEKASHLFTGPETVDECLRKYAHDTPSNYAANQIRDACFQLYPVKKEVDSAPAQ